MFVTSSTTWKFDLALTQNLFLVHYNVQKETTNIKELILENQPGEFLSIFFRQFATGYAYFVWKMIVLLRSGPKYLLPWCYFTVQRIHFLKCYTFSENSAFSFLSLFFSFAGSYFLHKTHFFFHQSPHYSRCPSNKLFPLILKDCN